MVEKDYGCETILRETTAKCLLSKKVFDVTESQGTTSAMMKHLTNICGSYKLYGKKIEKIEKNTNTVGSSSMRKVFSSAILMGLNFKIVKKAFICYTFDWHIGKITFFNSKKLVEIFIFLHVLQRENNEKFYGTTFISV